MKNKTLYLGGAILLFLMLGCGIFNRSEAEMRSATEVPERFFPPEGIALDNTACRSPMQDPRDGTTLLMIRSFGDGRGDYQVPNGKYGVRRGELLRINCSTGEVLGIVRR